VKITKLEINNFKSFAIASIEFCDGINLIIGPNNSGKSALLKSILWLQIGYPISHNDIRISQSSLSIKIDLSKDNGGVYLGYPDPDKSIMLSLSKDYLKVESTAIIPGHPNLSRILADTPGRTSYEHTISNIEPQNFIYPYLSKRKVVTYNEAINLGVANSVTGNFVNLYSKVDRLSNPQLPAYNLFNNACIDVLGFQISAIPSMNGKAAAYIVSNRENILLDSMGEGIANLVGLIVDLCMAENQLFLIEEPENDIHPKALKKLLKLIENSASRNQFIITTHSNIVVKQLGSYHNSKLFRLTMDFDEYRLPTSKVEAIDNTPESRLQVLDELGYELLDFDMWSAWLILEESSAERIIRDYLIPWFAPELQGKLRTCSANSISQVESKFESLNNLFIFLHLQPTYKDKAWVIIDAGENEKAIIDRLKNNYKSWDMGHFRQFSEHDFESYYPKEFKEDITSVLAITDKSQLREQKKQLINKVLKWISENPDSAKTALEESAKEVIGILKEIESKVVPTSKAV
jgi:predicted ATP-dependent endonuclease of OLD family